MTTETLGIKIKNKGLLLFGIILLLIGLIASFYVERTMIQGLPDYWGNPGPPIEISRTYPYQGIGIVLVLAGIIFVAIGFFYSPRTERTS